VTARRWPAGLTRPGLGLGDRRRCGSEPEPESSLTCSDLISRQRVKRRWFTGGDGFSHRAGPESFGRYRTVTQAIHWQVGEGSMYSLRPPRLRGRRCYPAWQGYLLAQLVPYLEFGLEMRRLEFLSQVRARDQLAQWKFTKSRAGTRFTSARRKKNSKTKRKFAKPF
jgi:hypothetical protein